MSPSKKLLVLDVNGVLLHRTHKRILQKEADARFGHFLVYSRPYSSDFIEFCLDNFEVGIWSSAKIENLMPLVMHVFGNSTSRLAFIWDQSKCTDTGLKHPDNKSKPLLLKEIEKLWNREDDSLPWKINDYGPHNTLMVDDSPYKAAMNPPFTSIFPTTYEADAGDSTLRLGGTLHKYLEDIRHAINVQELVRKHPFGKFSQPWVPIWQGDAFCSTAVEKESSTEESDQGGRKPMTMAVQLKCVSRAISIIEDGEGRSNVSETSGANKRLRK